MKHFTPCSEETKNKIAEAQKRIGNRPSFKGHAHSEETKEKLRQSSKLTSPGRKHTEETKRKMSESMKGNRRGYRRAI